MKVEWVPPSKRLVACMFSQYPKDMIISKLKHVSRYFVLNKDKYWKKNIVFPDIIDNSYLKFCDGWVTLVSESIKPLRKHIWTRKQLDGLLKGLPIPITECCKFVGTLPWKMPTRKQKVWSQDPHIINYIIEKQDNSIPLHQDEMMLSGDWVTNREIIKRMAKPIKPEYSFEDLLNGVKHRPDFPVYRLEAPHSKHIFSTYVNPEAFSGVITSKIFGTSKAEAYSFGIHVAYRVLRHLVYHDEYIFDCSLYAVGGREKRCKYEEGATAESRLILMPEFASSQIAQLFSQRITNCFIEKFNRMLLPRSKLSF